MAQKSTTRAILSNIHALKERRYVNISASDELIDFERAVKLAELTQRQSEAIRLTSYVGLTQEKAAERMGIDRTNVTRAIEEGIRKIDEVYEEWREIDEWEAME